MNGKWWSARRMGKCAFLVVFVWVIFFFALTTKIPTTVTDSLPLARLEYESPTNNKVSLRLPTSKDFHSDETTENSSHIDFQHADDIGVFLQTRPYIVNPLDQALLLSPKDKCQGKVVLLLAVLSQYSYADRRNVIRRTWGGKYDGLDVRTVFVFGQQKTTQWNRDLRLESDRYQDVIQYDFEDTYENLIYKSLLILRWAREHCGNAQFVLKVDDDVLMMTPQLYTLLLSIKPPKGVLLGYANPRSDVLRGGKWKVPFKDFPFQKFPKYLSGMAYVMSQDVVATLLNAARRVPLIQVEDAFITGILANITNTHHMSDPYFFFHRKYYLKPEKTACQRLPGNTITLHLEEPTSISLADFLMMTYAELSACSKRIAQHSVRHQNLNESNSQQ